MNQWASDHTHGLIQQLFSPGALSSWTRLVLANAVYFRASWARSFNPVTKLKAFHLASGATSTVRFMSSARAGDPNALSVPFAETSSYDAVQLPYKGKQLSALVVMPTHSTLSQFDASLTSDSLGHLVRGLRTSAFELSMPTFTTQSDNTLNSALSSMGMSQAFSGSADLSRINPTAGLQVQAVEQHAYLQVTPRGTVAAATAGIGVELSSATRVAAPPMIINHPFLFLVRDNTTGTILFESTIENPAS